MKKSLDLKRINKTSILALKYPYEDHNSVNFCAVRLTVTNFVVVESGWRSNSFI